MVTGVIIDVNNGKSLLRYRGYNFSNPIAMTRGLTNWRCTFRGARHPCKVYLRTDNNLRIKAIFRNHNHPPPNYIKYGRGMYVKGSK